MNGPGRYDLLESSLLLILPTLAAAVRINPMFDLGLGLQLGTGSTKLSTMSLVSYNCHPNCGVPTDIYTSTTVD